MTRDKVIRREFALDEGDVIDMEAVKKSVTKIQQLGYFKMTEEPGFAPRTRKKRKSTSSSRARRPRATRSSSAPGTRASTASSASSRSRRATSSAAARSSGPPPSSARSPTIFDLSYTVPWFMDRNQSVGSRCSAGASTTCRSTRAGRAARRSTAKGIGLFDSLSLLYAYEDISASFPVRSAPVPPGQPVPPQAFTETTGTTSSITPAYRYDSRNDPFDPNRGFRLFASVQYAPGTFLGSSDSFFKPGRRRRRLHPGSIPAPGGHRPEPRGRLRQGTLRATRSRSSSASSSAASRASAVSGREPSCLSTRARTRSSPTSSAGSSAATSSSC